MLSTLAICPPLRDLYRLIDKVPAYPLNNRQLVKFAAKIKAPKEVVDFYRTFSDNFVYKSKEDLSTVSEQVDLMRQAETQMPKEIERGPEEF